MMVAEATKYENFGTGLDTSETSVWYHLNAPFALLISKFFDELESIETKRNVRTAEGVDLDDLLWDNFSFPRLENESDSEYRQRYYLRYQQSIYSNNRIKNAIESIGIKTKVYENDTGIDTPDIPAHSINVIVYSDDTKIAQIISDNKTPATGTIGTTTKQITSSSGQLMDVRYTIATSIQLQAFKIVGGVHTKLADTNINNYIASSDIGSTLNIYSAIANAVSGGTLSPGVGESYVFRKNGVATDYLEYQLGIREKAVSY